MMTNVGIFLSYAPIRETNLNSQRPKTLPLYLTCARMLQLPGISRFSTFSRSSFSRYLPFNEKTTFPPLSIDHPEDQPECHMSLALSHLSIHHNHCLSWKKKTTITHFGEDDDDDDDDDDHPAWRRCHQTYTDRRPDRPSPSSMRWWSVKPSQIEPLQSDHDNWQQSVNSLFQFLNSGRQHAFQPGHALDPFADEGREGHHGPRQLLQPFPGEKKKLMKKNNSKFKWHFKTIPSGLLTQSRSPSWTWWNTEQQLYIYY